MNNLTDLLNQFVEFLNGQFVELSSREAEYQCMDLAYAWILFLRLPKATIQNTYAYEVYTKPKTISLEYFEFVPNTPDAFPIDGDVVVFKGGTAGHIAIGLSGSTKTKLLIFEQNNPLGTHAHIQERSYTNVLGWLRLKKLPTNEPELAWLKQMFQARGIDLTQPEGTVRGRVQEIFDGSDKYQEAVKQKDKAIADLAEARGDATKWEENYRAAANKIDGLQKEIEDLSKKVTDRDSEITALTNRVGVLEAQLDPEKVIVLTREDYARLTATKTLDKFKSGELLVEIFTRLFRR